MLRKLIAPVLAAAAIPALSAGAGAAPSAPPRAEIPFADQGGVDDWDAEDLHRHWFRATLMTPAIDLPFAEHIGIDARPTGTLDKFGGIYVHGRHYTFASFEVMPGPPPKKAHRRR
jgi:hypothetical protein